ncbi:hypothetical protein ACJRPK_13960 [Aquimarina sp. 2-A2]|uniref:hypothetical protein n=1 Tax=Aquimarina sp. 2-A2 TaxID=3382644 RepID=UPI00387F0A87
MKIIYLMIAIDLLGCTDKPEETKTISGEITYYSVTYPGGEVERLYTLQSTLNYGNGKWDQTIDTVMREETKSPAYSINIPEDGERDYINRMYHKNNVNSTKSSPSLGIDITDWELNSRDYSKLVNKDIVETPYKANKWSVIFTILFIVGLIGLVISNPR